MSESQSFRIPIPKGYRIFFGQMEVAGAGYRKGEIAKAFSGKQVNLGIEPEPKNKHDRNALKVIAFKKGWFGTKKIHIGYIPRDIAQIISDKGFSSPLLPRLKEVWFGDRGGVKISIDILGVKDEYHKLQSN